MKDGTWLTHADTKPGIGLRRKLLLATLVMAISFSGLFVFALRRVERMIAFHPETDLGGSSKGRKLFAAAP